MSRSNIDNDATQTRFNRGGASRNIKRVVAAVLLTSSATLALSAWSGPGPQMHRGPGGHGGPGGPGAVPMLDFGGPGLFGGPGSRDPEQLGRRIDRMLDGLNATDAQRTQIKEIARLASVDLQAQRERDREGGKALREKGLQLFAAPTIDANAVEQLRQQMDAQQDARQKRSVQAMIDIGRVLTPQQRATAVQMARFEGDRMEERMKRMRDDPQARPDGAGPGGPREGRMSAPAGSAPTR